MRSTHDAAEFQQVFLRMAGYYPGSTPLKPQRLVGDAARRLIPADQAPAAAEWLASINLSAQETWSWPLQTLPRLTGMWKHLERQAGGIGTRGPGETQLETDRRIVREKIARLKAELQAVEVEPLAWGSRFAVRSLRGGLLGRVELPVPGRHNVANALAAIAVGLSLRIDWPAIAAALAGFKGVHRRFEPLGSWRGATVVDDYAHHPTEVAATLDAARQTFPRARVHAVFQPHLFSRTRDLADELGNALLGAPETAFATLKGGAGNNVFRVGHTGQGAVCFGGTGDNWYDVASDSGNVTVYVSDMDRAVDFYGNKLGLKVGQRFGNHWAEFHVGQTLVIGLHPKSDRGPAPGTHGAMSIGLTIDEPIDQAVQRLTANGVKFRGPVVRDQQAGLAFAFFGDQDGNDLYLCEVTKTW